MGRFSIFEPQVSDCYYFILAAPALVAVENEVKIPELRLSADKSPFQAPSSPDLDRTWEDLYNCTFSISQFGLSYLIILSYHE